MSAYTDREHYEIIEATKAWKNDPVTAQEYYLYGKLQYRLKDYYKAAVSYKAAVELGYGPAKFALAFAMFREEGIYKSSEYTVLAKEGYDYYAKLPSKTSEQFYYLAMALRYGVGC